MSVDLQTEVDVDVIGLGAIFPARACDFVHIDQQLIDRNWFKVVIAPLARKILYPPDCAGSIIGGLNDLSHH